jgi:putative superfamily III holin-X
MFLIYLLKLALPLWAAALIVTVVYGVVGAALAMAGKKKLDEARSPVPEQTVESVKEDVQWLRTQTRSDER